MYKNKSKHIQRNASNHPPLRVRLFSISPNNTRLHRANTPFVCVYIALRARARIKSIISCPSDKKTNKPRPQRLFREYIQLPLYMYYPRQHNQLRAMRKLFSSPPRCIIYSSEFRVRKLSSRDIFPGGVITGSINAKFIVKRGRKKCCYIIYTRGCVILFFFASARVRIYEKDD